MLALHHPSRPIPPKYQVNNIYNTTHLVLDPTVHFSTRTFKCNIISVKTLHILCLSFSLHSYSWMFPLRVDGTRNPLERVCHYQVA